MSPRVNLLVIDLADSSPHRGQVGVIVNRDFATTHERAEYVETFAKEHGFASSELLEEGYVIIAEEWDE